MDWIGAVLNAATWVIFMVAITFGGSTFAWNSGTFIALIVVFGVCLIAYILQQTFAILTTKENRTFPVHFLKSRTLILLYTATASAGAAQYITLYYTPLYFQFTQGDSALRAAVRLLPFICMFIFFVMVAGGSLPIVGRYNLYYILGGCLIVIGGALLYTIDANTSSSWIYGSEVLIATGIGICWQNAYSVGPAKVAPRDIPKVIGFINVAQIGTISIALAIGGSLFQNLGFAELKSAFEGYSYSDDFIRSALAGRISPVFSLADQDAVRIAVVAVANTIRRVFAMAIAAGAVTAVSGLFMKFERIQLDPAAAG